VLPLALLEFLEKNSIHLPLASNADVQRRQLQQLLIGVADHGLEGSIGRNEAVLVINQRNAEYRVLKY
jgi:hypothetical protein